LEQINLRSVVGLGEVLALTACPVARLRQDKEVTVVLPLVNSKATQLQVAVAVKALLAVFPMAELALQAA
jgi:hypothetical protein